MPDRSVEGKLSQRSKRILDVSWEMVQEHPLTEDYAPEYSDVISSMLRHSLKTYRYVLPTQLVAKLANRKLDARCIQLQREAEPGTGENFNARTLCQKVIVPFERSIDEPLGGSGDPYVNNPLRVPEVSSKYRENQRDKDGWDTLSNILSLIETTNDASFVKAIWLQVLLEIRRIQQEVQIRYPVPQRINLTDTVSLLEEFLRPRTGGSRLQTVSVALFRTLQEIWNIYDDVISAQITVADTQGGRPADIDCVKNGTTALAVEVKDRTLTLDQLQDKISSCRVAGVTELMFLIRSASLVADESVTERAAQEFIRGMNINILDAENFFTQVLQLIAERGRIVFLHKVSEALEEFRLDFVHRKHWAELLENI